MNEKWNNIGGNEMDNEMKAFDPLWTKYNGSEEVVIKSVKREIGNILNSYVGWYDPFCELIQNALDAVDKRREVEEFDEKIHLLIDLKNNKVSVTDNGIGFKEAEYLKFLAPNFSFKPGGTTRGHKGVGATYLAYGFNYIQIATKNPDFSAVGVMKGARHWLDDPAPASNPQVMPDANEVEDFFYATIDRGTSMTIKCDSESYPKDLSWMGLHTADAWLYVLRVQTGLGQIKLSGNVKIIVDVLDKTGVQTTATIDDPKYLSIEEFVDKVKSVTEIKNKMDELYKKSGPNYRMPARYSKLEAVYDFWNCSKLLAEIKFDTAQEADIKKYDITVIFSYVYSLAVWDKVDSIVGIRKGNHVLYGGIQLAANNMPQGELIQIPLTKNIGRQKQANVLIHFENCSADLGRKGFKKEITDLGKEIARRLMDGPLMKVRSCFKANSGASPDLRREKSLAEWKKSMTEHEHNFPLIIDNPNFFNPMKKVSITSYPTREQDVIALFNQLLAGGVIRGIKIMATNERSTYDSLYRIEIKKPKELQIFDECNNPLGIVEDAIDDILENEEVFLSDPQVLEYKYSLNGLIEDIESGVKNTNDIDLVVAWESGDRYRDNYIIESLLIDGNEGLRRYHGVTHHLHDANTNEYVCDMILLKDLILYLNDRDQAATLQDSYDD